jgi:glyoxylase-like metal-dependent hydrolase (beta-lactamase superfamily II)
MDQFHFHRIPLGIDNCYLLCGNKNILIDGGAPGHMEDLRTSLARLGISADEIFAILLPHRHADHIGSLHAIQGLTGAQVWVHQAERSSVENGNPALPPGITAWGRTLVGVGHCLYRPKIIPCKVDRALGDCELSLVEYGIPGRVIHTPGHSAGSVCVLLDTGEVFAGDMAMNVWFLRRTPGLGILAENRKEMVENWKKLIDIGARWVYPAHGKDFSIEVIQEEIIRIERV